MGQLMKRGKGKEKRWEVGWQSHQHKVPLPQVAGGGELPIEGKPLQGGRVLPRID